MRGIYIDVCSVISMLKDQDARCEEVVMLCEQLSINVPQLLSVVRCYMPWELVVGLRQRRPSAVIWQGPSFSLRVEIKSLQRDLENRPKPCFSPTLPS